MEVVEKFVQNRKINVCNLWKTTVFHIVHIVENFLEVYIIQKQG